MGKGFRVRVLKFTFGPSCLQSQIPQTAVGVSHRPCIMPEELYSSISAPKQKVQHVWKP